MWEQNPTTTDNTPPARGDIGYAIIKTKISNMYNFLAYNNEISINNVLTYAGNSDTKPYQGQYGVDWDDNNVQPDEHVWEIKYYPTGTNAGQFSIKNTAYGYYMPNSATTKYLSIIQNSYIIKNYAVQILPPGGGTPGIMYTHFNSGSINAGFGYIDELVTNSAPNTSLDQYQFEFDFI